jgi:hypothetical protein
MLESRCHVYHEGTKKNSKVTKEYPEKLVLFFVSFVSFVPSW